MSYDYAEKIKTNSDCRLPTADFRLNRGFSLVELLVAMAIFLIVITIVTQIFIMGMGGTKRLFGRQNALDSVRFIMESMSRELRMSKITAVTGDYSSLTITNSKGEVVDYSFSGANINRAGSALNPDDVLISNGCFHVISPISNSPPRVTITMTVTSVSAKVSQQAQVNLQTTVSSRWYRPN